MIATICYIVQEAIVINSSSIIHLDRNAAARQSTTDIGSTDLASERGAGRLRSSFLLPVKTANRASTASWR